MSKMELNRRRILMTGAAHAQGSSSMARLILVASRTTGTDHRPAAWLPSSACRFSDQQIADMAACARSAWHSRTRSAATNA